MTDVSPKAVADLVKRLRAHPRYDDRGNPTALGQDAADMLTALAADRDQWKERAEKAEARAEKMRDEIKPEAQRLTENYGKLAGITGQVLPMLMERMSEVEADRDQWKERAAQTSTELYRERSMWEFTPTALNVRAMMGSDLPNICSDKTDIPWIKRLREKAACGLRCAKTAHDAIRIEMERDRLAAECERMREALTRIAGDGSTATIPQGIAREALSTQPAASPWRPIVGDPDISVEPWGGDPVLICKPGMKRSWRGYWRMAGPRAGWRWEAPGLGAVPFKPTHWMPLPPPPADQEGEGK